MDGLNSPPLMSLLDMKPDGDNPKSMFSVLLAILHVHDKRKKWMLHGTVFTADLILETTKKFVY
ncbi:hypothetical protein SDC9_41140 [bioreactor metagenome]|uniref:Uncharacterized protein n=1 Tax=bioreactor metagenome TaxID=1076179 RepID=A0A644VUM7_9ZZZZ